MEVVPKQNLVPYPYSFRSGDKVPHYPSDIPADLVDACYTLKLTLVNNEQDTSEDTPHPVDLSSNESRPDENTDFDETSVNVTDLC